MIAASERAGRAERVMATISVMAITCYRAMADYNCPQINIECFLFSFFFNERLTQEFTTNHKTKAKQLCPVK